jgi:hypothetical protein
MSAKSYIVKKINDLPTFTGTLSPDDLVAFFDISTGITHKIKVSEIGGGAEGTTDHRDLSEESRFANNQHIMGSVTGLTEKIDQLDAKDDSLQDQILTMQENNPVQQIRYLTSDPIVLNTETFYQSKADKGTAPAFEITTLITATTPETADIVAQWVGVALTQPLELIDQITSLLIKARKNGTQRTVTLFAEFYDYTSAGVKILKGTSSQVILTDTITAYDLYFQIQAYLAAAGSRGLIIVKGFQTGAGAAASIILSIEGDYYSRWSYTIPTAALLLQDTQIKSTQDLPAIGSLAGEGQDEINRKLANRVERGITIDGSSIAVVRDYYSAQTDISEIIARGVTLVERSTDNITFIIATPPFSVLGDIWWRITPSAETSFVKIKGQII